MDDKIIMSSEEYANLNDRLNKLAVEKSYLQVFIHLMSEMNSVSGLENTIQKLLQLILENIGGSNLIIYYKIDHEIHYADVLGKTMKIEQIEDDVVAKVFKTKELIEIKSNFADTKLLSSEFTQASTWAFPLMVGTELIAVLKIEYLYTSIIDLHFNLTTFFSYVAHILKNEILDYTKLKTAFNQLTDENNLRKQAEEELKAINNELEDRVVERTNELHQLNIQLEEELTERTQAETQILKLNRIYAVLSNINQAIVRIHDTNELLKEACRIAIEQGNFQMAWVGMVNRQTNKVDVVASNGFVGDYLEIIDIDLNVESRSNGPTGIAIKTGVHKISNNIELDDSMLSWREDAIKYGYKSSASFPLIVLNKVVGAFSIYSNETHFFQQEDIKLLDEMAIDISFALEFIDAETEHKKVEKELLRSEKELKRAQEITHIGSWYLDVSTNEVIWTEELYKMYGFDPKLPVPPYTEHMKLFTPESWEILSTSLARTRETGIPYELELNTIKENGSRGWMWVRGETILDSEGNTIGLWGAAQDITERKKLEEKLRESEYKLGESARIAHVGYWDRDLIEQTIILSEEACNIFGLPSNFQTPSLNEWHTIWLKLIHPDDQQRAAKAVADTLTDGTPYNIEYRVILADGTIKHVHSFAELTKNKLGKPIRMFGTMLDITERKQIEDALRETAQRLNQAQRLAHIGSWELDLENYALHWSDEIYRIFEIDPNKFGATYDAFLEVIHPDDREAVNLAYTNSLKTKTSYVIDHRLLFPDGRVKYVHEQCETYYEGDKPIRSIGTVQDITERKLADEALKQSEWRYREIFDNVLDGLYLLEVTEDGHFRTIEVNPALERITGVPRSFSIGKTQEETVPAEIAEIVNAKYLNCVKAGHPIEEEAVLNMPVGKRYFHSTLIPARDQAGRIYRIIGISRDITEQKESEQKLKLLNFALNNIYEEAFLIDEKACFNYVNDESCRVLGYSRDELLKMNVTDIDPDFPYEKWQEHWDIVMEKGSMIFETHHKTKKGNIYPVEISVSYFEYNGKGYNLALVRDITERKRLEEALFFVAQRGWQTSMENFFNTLAQFLSEKLDMEYVFIDKIDENSDVAETVALYAKGSITPNMRYALKGTPCENVMGKRLCIYPQGIQQLFPEDTLLPEMGAESYIGIPLWDSTGQPIGLIAVLGLKPLPDDAPVTQLLQLVATRAAAELERKQAEEKILKLNQELELRVENRTAQLEAANKELEAFSYSVAHDLRSPLRGIDGFSQVLLEEYQDKFDHQGIDYLHRVRAATQRMAQLIDALLNLSRINRYVMNVQQVNLSKIAKEISADYCESQPERKVEFIIQEGIEAQGDAHLLGIVLENLMGNAWKFTSNHATARIEFGTILHEDATAYFVRDDGAGFNMNHAQKLFGAFQRLHTVNEFAGTGIGLATVQRIIHRHSGRIWTESEVEKGAAFYFTIP